MKILYSFALLALWLVATDTLAQDTCRDYSIPNPHGAAMSINRVWVVDSVNFSVQSVRPLPHQIGASGTFDITVCILARDGQPHSTIVRYTNTHGTSSYPVTMTAPAVSGVEKGEEYTLRLSLALPNPASSTVSIDLGYSPSDRVGASIVDMSGRRVLGDIEPLVSGDRLVVDVSSLATGRYLVQVLAPGRPAASWPIIIQR